MKFLYLEECGQEIVIEHRNISSLAGSIVCNTHFTYLKERKKCSIWYLLICNLIIQLK